MNLPVEKRRQWIRSRREQRKLTKLARFRRQFMRYSVLAALLFAGSVAFYKIHWYLPNHDSSDKSITVKGNFVASNQQILQVLQKSITVPIFSLNPKDLENRVEHLDVIKQAFIRRYALPYPRLQVDVLEEFPWASLYLDDATDPQYVIAQSGRLISTHDYPNVFQPVLKIYGLAKYKGRMNEDGVSRWANWIAYIEKQTQSPVLSIDMREQYNVKVATGKFVIALGSPDSSLTSRLYRLASVLEVLASEKRQPVYVNLGLNSNIPVKLAVNERGKATGAVQRPQDM